MTVQNFSQSFRFENVLNLFMAKHIEDYIVLSNPDRYEN